MALFWINILVIIKGAYEAKAFPPLSNSDHSNVHLLTYRQICVEVTKAPDKDNAVVVRGQC